MVELLPLGSCFDFYILTQAALLVFHKSAMLQYRYMLLVSKKMIPRQELFEFVKWIILI